MPESSVFHSESILYDAVWIQYEIYFTHLKDICGSGIYPTWILCAIVKYSKCSKCQKFKLHEQVIRLSWSTVFGPRFIPRLNPEIERIFELSVWNLNLNSSDFRAYKIIWNDIKVDPFSWKPKREKSTFQLLRRRLSRWTSRGSKDVKEKSTSFDINFVVVRDGTNMVSNEKPTQNWK